MRKFLISMMMTGLLSGLCELSFAETQETNVEEGLESLLFMEIPMITTASKIEQKEEKTPAAITVITSSDIKSWGVRSLEEVLKRTVGFFPTTSQDWAMIASRGITSDMNHLYLVLIDGHSINSINGWGMMNQHVIPLLSQVDRIEIIRGPGSTMWGSDAVMATINIITKKGSDINGIITSYNYSAEENQQTSNILLGNKTENNADYMLSFTYFDSDGYHSEKEDGSYNKEHHPKATSTSYMGEWEDWEPSWELFGKAKVDNFTLMARQLRWTQIEPMQNRPLVADAAYTIDKVYTLEREYNSTFIEGSYLKELSETSSLETKIFSDIITKSRYPVTNTISNDQEYKENGYGTDVIYRQTIKDVHHLLFGLRANIVDVGPNTNGKYNSATSRSANTTTDTYLITPSGTDETYGVYLEDQYDMTEKLTFVLGGREDKNNFREDSSQFMPRFSTIYSLTEEFTVKYLYNTGYYRPAVNHSMRNITDSAYTSIRNAEDSIKTDSHDIQFVFKNDYNNLNVTFFYMTLDKFIANVGNITGSTIQGGYENLGDVESKGVEVDYRRKITDTFYINCNYAYAKAEITEYYAGLENIVKLKYTNYDDELICYPRHTYNIGCNWTYYTNCNFNLNLRGWADAETHKSLTTSNGYNTSATFEKLNGEQYVDINFLFENIANLPLSVSLYCQNLLDNAGKTPGNAGSTTWYYEKEQNIGAKVTYVF